MTDERPDETDVELAVDLDARLQAIGSADVPPVDDLTVARIEQRLRAQHGGRRTRPNVLAPVLAGVAAALVVVALANVGSDDRAIGTAGTGRDLGAPGLTVAPFPGAVDPTLVDPTGDDGVEAPEDDDVAADDDDRRNDAGEPPAETSVPRPATDDQDPRPGDGPTTTVATRPTSVDTCPTTTTTRPTDEKPTPVRISVRVEARGKSAVIAWTEYPGDDLASWSIVRTTEPPEGSLAPAREEVVLRDGDPAVRRFVDEPDARGQVSYVVRGHRRDGTVVARSSSTPLER